MEPEQLKHIQYIWSKFKTTKFPADSWAGSTESAARGVYVMCY